jgi:hypothetical protein
MSREMLDMVEVLAREKNVEQSAVFGVLELALASAVKKSQFPGEDADIVVSVNQTTGDWTAKRRWVVVSDDQGLQQPDREEMFSDIHDEHPDLQVGDYIEVPVDNINTSGRRFAQDAKQLILQRLRDAEREQILNEFLEPMRQRRHEFEQDIPEIYNILKKGTEQARETAAQTMSEVRSAMQINYFDDQELIQSQAERFRAK